MAERDMDDFKEEVRTEMERMAASVSKTAESVDRMASAVQSLVESDIRKQEREQRQAEINQSHQMQLDILKKFREEILIKRAEESQARNFLQKYWAQMMLLVLLGYQFVTKMIIK